MMRMMRMMLSYQSQTPGGAERAYHRVPETRQKLDSEIVLERVMQKLMLVVIVAVLTVLQPQLSRVFDLHLLLRILEHQTS